MDPPAAFEEGRRWTRVRTLGRGASGAEVFLAADEASGRLLAVKSASPGPCAAALRRERGVMAGLRSPHVVPCVGGRACPDGSYQLFLEFAPGGSLADFAARGGGRRLEERDVRRFAADVARGLAYVHAAGLVHGDVKPRNVVVGADGRAKLADFGCARKRAAEAASGPIIGGTPAFMAPEVARGEEQGPAADVWALGCTVLEMATGLAPWSHVGVDDVLAAVRLIGYSDAVPEVPGWLSADARDFVGLCLARCPSDRPTAAELLEHPFIASSASGAGSEEVISSSSKGNNKWWVSPKSTLDAAFWESDTDTDTDEEDDGEAAHSAAARIEALASVCSVSGSPLPEWDNSDADGWIDVISTHGGSSPDAVVSVPVEQKNALDDGGVSNEEGSNNDVEAADPLDVDVDSGDSSARNVGETDADSADHDGHHPARLNFVALVSVCDHNDVPCRLLLVPHRRNVDNGMNFILGQEFSLCLKKSHSFQPHSRRVALLLAQTQQILTLLRGETRRRPRSRDRDSAGEKQRNDAAANPSAALSDYTRQLARHATRRNFQRREREGSRPRVSRRDIRKARPEPRQRGRRKGHTMTSNLIARAVKNLRTHQAR